MIVRIHSAGKSFKGLATYLTHDPNAKTDERVAWTHTHNLAHDHVPSAVDEMLWTARSAELLKQEAGLRAGGRASEIAIKHVSLNWSPEEKPDREHMVETAESFLREMKWHEHQAVIVAHEDKAYAHVHLMINTVHPETGRHLDDNFERRRAQKWALGYEQENGQVYCEQRLKNIGERDEAPTRPAWMSFREKQTEFEREENTRRDEAVISPEQPENPNAARSAEWKRLKEIQRHERQTFFAEGKLEFSELRGSIYREVREEYRGRWADYYALQKGDGDPATIADMKKELIAEQTALLEKRRDEACSELNEARDKQYRDLLGDQRDIRHQMRWRQEAGLDNAIFLRAIEDRTAGDDRPRSTFRDTAEETAKRPAVERDQQHEPAASRRGERSGFKSGPDVGGSIATGLGFGLLSIFCGVVDVLGGSSQPAPSKQSEPEGTNSVFDGVIEEARKRQQLEEDEADSEKRKRQRSYGD